MFGPRSTGKTTAIEDAIRGKSPPPIWIDLLDDQVFQEYLRSPSELLKRVSDQPQAPIVIDEIQRLPKLLNEVQRLLQKNSDLRFLMTGSSARKLRRKGSNLLGGRAWEARMLPLTFAEIPDFDLEKYLNCGGIPSIYLSQNPKEELRAYTSLYLREEIVNEAAVRNLENFTRFIDAMALQNGRELHFQGIAKDVGFPAKTVANYVDILKDTLLGYELPAFRKTRHRKAITRSKFYFFDVGVAHHLSRSSELIRPGSELFGAALEHWVIGELRAMLSYQRRDETLTYWRSTSGFEVDVIVGNRAAIEIKATQRVQSQDLRGLKALREEGLIQKMMLVSRDPERRTVEGIELIPWWDWILEIEKI